MQPHRLRTIAPKDRPEEGDIKSAASQALGATHSLSRKTRGHIACENCRRGKKKCDGQRPTCSNCRSQAIECSYPTPAREAVREVKELEDHLALVKALLFSVTDMEDPTVAMRIISKMKDKETAGDPMSATDVRTLMASDVDAFFPNVSNLVPVRAREILATSLGEKSNFGMAVASSAIWSEETGQSFTPLGSQQMLTETGSSSAVASSATDNEPSTTTPDSSRSPSTGAGTSTSFRNLTFVSAIFGNHHSQALQNTQEHTLHLPPWQVLPLNLEDYYFVDLDLSRAVSAAIVSYRNKARLYLAIGGNSHSIFNSVINQTFLQTALNELPDHSIATWAVRWVKAFEELGPLSLSFRMAVVHLAMLMMRWQLDPNPTTFAAIPSWFQPTAAQKFIPHFSFIDFIVWPKIREALIQAVGRQAALIIKHMSFSWPLADEDIFAINATSGELDLSDEFKNHTLDLHNWALHSNVRLDLTYLANVYDEASSAT